MGCFVNFFFTRSGHIHKQIEPVSIWVDAYPSWACYAADFMWLFLVGRILVYEVVDIVSSIRLSGCKGGLMEYMNPWNIVDWLSILFAAILIAIWINYLMALGKLRGWLDKVDLSTPGSLQNDEDLAQFFHDAHQAILQKQWVR